MALTGVVQTHKSTSQAGSGCSQPEPSFPCDIFLCMCASPPVIEISLRSWANTVPASLATFIAARIENYVARIVSAHVEPVPFPRLSCHAGCSVYADFESVEDSGGIWPMWRCRRWIDCHLDPPYHVCQPVSLPAQAIANLLTNRSCRERTNPCLPSSAPSTANCKARARTICTSSEASLRRAAGRRAPLPRAATARALGRRPRGQPGRPRLDADLHSGTRTTRCLGDARRPRTASRSISGRPAWTMPSARSCSGFTAAASLAAPARPPIYDGQHLARRGDVVVVTINYRLGALGYLYNQALTDGDDPQSGNYGMRDQVAALEWVRDHISASSAATPTTSRSSESRPAA